MGIACVFLYVCTCMMAVFVCVSMCEQETPLSYSFHLSIMGDKCGSQ